MAPSSSNNLPVVPWPPFLLASKVCNRHMCIDMDSQMLIVAFSEMLTSFLNIPGTHRSPYGHDFQRGG